MVFRKIPCLFYLQWGIARRHEQLPGLLFSHRGWWALLNRRKLSMKHGLQTIIGVWTIVAICFALLFRSPSTPSIVLFAVLCLVATIYTILNRQYSRTTFPKSFAFKTRYAKTRGVSLEIIVPLPNYLNNVHALERIDLALQAAINRYFSKVDFLPSYEQLGSVLVHSVESEFLTLGLKSSMILVADMVQHEPDPPPAPSRPAGTPVGSKTPLI